MGRGRIGVWHWAHLSMTLTLAVPSQRGADGPMLIVSAWRRMTPRGSLSSTVIAKSAGEKPPAGDTGEGGCRVSLERREGRFGTCGKCGMGEGNREGRTGVEEEGDLTGRAVDHPWRRAADELQLPLALRVASCLVLPLGRRA